MTEFIGFPRPDGSVGIRNHVLLLGLDQTGLNVCYKVAGLVKESLLVISRIGDRRVFSEVVRHPNAAGSVVIGEGLKAEDKEGLVSDLERWGKPLGVIDMGGLGFMEAIGKASQTAMDMVQDVSTHRRALVRVSKLLTVLFHTYDDLTTAVFDGFLKRLREENGRSLWVEKGAKNQKDMNLEIKTNLAGDVGIGEVPGPDPGVYRYMGPENDEAILRTVLVSGAQIMAFPSGERRFMANALIPGLSFSLGRDLGADQICGLNLGQKEGKNLSTEDAGLLLFSEILATASGKLTRDELFCDVLIIG
jgi:altronate dehydratase large subunit